MVKVSASPALFLSPLTGESTDESSNILPVEKVGHTLKREKSFIADKPSEPVKGEGSTPE